MVRQHRRHLAWHMQRQHVLGGKTADTKQWLRQPSTSTAHWQSHHCNQISTLVGYEEPALTSSASSQSKTTTSYTSCALGGTHGKEKLPSAPKPYCGSVTYTAARWPRRMVATAKFSPASRVTESVSQRRVSRPVFAVSEREDVWAMAVQARTRPAVC